MAKQHHEWFVYPKNSDANESVAKYLQSGENFEDITLLDALCVDEKKRDLWRCTETQAYFLWRSPGLKIKIFNRLGPNGKIRDVTFLFRKDRRGAKKRSKKNVKT